jgi:nucleoside-diphosphate-sugar epimerase
MDLLAAAGIPYRQIDARDYHRLSRAVAAVAPDAIVHLAAVAHITVTKLDAHLAFDNSINTLKNALDVAVAIGCKHFVYLSSSTVYGNFQKAIIDETEPLRPDNTYGAFKQCGEILVERWRSDHGLAATIVRPQALYGARCVSRRVTQVFVENALSGMPLRIDGDGSAKHDFTHIDDLTAGISAVLSNRHAAVGQTFCMTAGQAVSLLTLAEIIQANIPGTVIEFGPADPDKPSRGTMTVSKAWRCLGWQPRVRLADGMASLIDWYKEFLAEEKRHAA